MTRLVALTTVALLLLVGAEGGRGDSRNASGRAEVLVTLASPPLALAPASGAVVAAEQRAFRAALAERVPEAHVRWRYRLVANGFAVELPVRQLAELRRLPGVHAVTHSVGYAPALDRSPGQIGANAIWGAGLDTAGQGVKIGIIDAGLDHRHPFFSPAGYTMPSGFPKGRREYTTAKVIVARAFPPPRSKLPFSRVPFDPGVAHGTHVAGIAAGNADTPATGGRAVSGVAPKAYIGNYKVFTRAPSGFSPNANAPEIVAAIEAAVADGMDVINLSLGEPEIDARRDVVALALDAAAAAGVVPVVAAGNDYDETGAGSVSSPGNSARAITVGAVEISGSPVESVHASFSSVGPTAVSLRLKPDVAAPGVDIISAVPGGGWSGISGTSMASPHVAGAAALLLQRHPQWTVADVKSALVQSGQPTTDGQDAGPQFLGGGVVSLARADRPRLLATPSGVSLGLLGRGGGIRGSIELRDAGDGAGTWSVTRQAVGSPAGALLALPAQVEVPGTLSYEALVGESASEGDVSGYIELRRGTDVRRIPYWGRVTAPALNGHKVVPLLRQGVHRATTRGKPALVQRYRYPEAPGGATTVLRGPELVYRVRIARPVANFGVVVTRLGRGTRVEPRVVAVLDENRVTGYAGLPFAYSPYLGEVFEPLLVAGSLSPVPGDYAVVFDSATPATAGSFTFRFWLNDVTPPTVRVRARTVRAGRPVLVGATDAGSGVYPDSIEARLGREAVDATYARGVVRIDTAGLAPGKHRLRLRVSDYQETKNTENVARILPNTRTLTATVTIRRGG
jgi:subtilisin family serine protease